MDTQLKNGYVIIDLHNSLKSGVSDIKRLEKLIALICEGSKWKKYRIPMTDEIREPESFDEFCENELNVTIDELKNLCDIATRSLIDSQRQQPHGANQFTTESRGGVYYTPPPIRTGNKPSGTSIEAGLRRLKKDRPDLYDQVLSGELRVNTAMRQAGFRPRRIEVRPDDPEAVNRSLRKHMTEEALFELKELLK